ncbi:MAG: NAD(P)(+) transhydrogenase (Re/Si-specific) subunit beta, partial [Holosporaceae bacterium]|nr:NAD(P)(+) transhydrogenase (Re/Si-specific) subunit beta [Holosporaceae bacterium]
MVNVFYLVAAICFILALNGLSSAENARRGNLYGILGIIIVFVAVYSTLDFPDIYCTALTVVIGGFIGVVIAKTVSMMALPQMIAGFHSLVGLAAVLIAFSVYLVPRSFGIASATGVRLASLIEIGLG